MAWTRPELQVRDSVRAAPGAHPHPAQKTGLPTSDPHPRRTWDPAPFPAPAPKAQPPPGWEGEASRDPAAVPPRPARAHLPQPGVPGPRAAAAEVVSKAGPDATPAPRPGGSGGSGGDFGRWRGTAAPRGAGRGAPGSAARRQVRAERGALCGGGAGTAVRAAPARARSATPRLGTRAGSAGRGQCLSRPSIASGLAPAPGVALPRGPRVSQDPRVTPFQDPHPSPAWPTLGPSQVPPPPILEGKSCFSEPEASQCQREEDKRSRVVVSAKLVPRAPTGGLPCVCPESRGLCCPSTVPPVGCLGLTGVPRLCSTLTGPKRVM